MDQTASSNKSLLTAGLVIRLKQTDRQIYLKLNQNFADIYIGRTMIIPL
jgi:hypothetical protein